MPVWADVVVGFCIGIVVGWLIYKEALAWRREKQTWER